MLDSQTLTLSITALSIGVVHTLAGPDHYLPFVSLAKVKSWSRTKTFNIVAICGIGHVLSSVLLGILGIYLGTALSRLEFFEGFRGNIAAWLLFSFGVAYTLWGIYKVKVNKGHSHKKMTNKGKTTFWVLFLIFVFGPCEPLIPILMYPAAEINFSSVLFIALVFTIATVITMLITVGVLLKGISLIKLTSFEKYQHVIAGSAITLCGAGILFMGL